MPTIEAPPVDGRRQRRDRNREQVVTALLGLYREGNVTPSTEEIAARAGLSPRSVFRYFEDTDALVRTAILRQQDHLAPLYALSVGAADPLADRIEGFARDRARLLEEMGAVGRVARTVAHRQPRVAAELARIRAALRSQVAELFAAELERRAPADAAATLAALDVLTSWEAHHLLRADLGLRPAAARRVMALGLARLLGEEG